MRAFSLLEVLATLLLFSIAFTGIIRSQGGSTRAIVKSEKLAQAVALAEQKMTELEIEAQKKNFQAFDDEERGEFDGEGLENFRYVVELEPVDLGCFLPDLGDSNLTEQGAFQLAQNIFEQSIRKVKVRVEWDDQSTQSAELVQLLVRFEDLPDNF